MGPTSKTETLPHKIVFANQLRGLCVIAVLLVHYLVVVQYMRRDVASVIAAPALDTPLSPVGLFIYPPWLDLGKFGVGAFFLISGFVIPFSLRGSSRGVFLLARALRIYPTFWLALFVEGASIAASSAYWHVPPAFGPRDYFFNGLLVHTALGLPSVDWVSWTLSIEVKFYLLAALLRPWLLAHRVWPLFAVALAALGSNLVMRAYPTLLPVQLASEAMFLGYIMIGLLFHYRYQGAIAAGRFAACLFGLTALFFVVYGTGPMRSELQSLHTASFGLAVLVFGAGYAMRARLRPNRLLDALAAISYPLYLVHAVVGFIAINFLTMAWRVPFLSATLLAAVLSVLIGSALHFAIERPTIRLGHSLRHRSLSLLQAGTPGPALSQQD